MKKLIILLLITFNLTAQSTIEVNTNPNSIELSAFILNDTLKLSCEYRIEKVDIFNSEIPFNFEKYSYEKKMDIDLRGFPNGRFLVNAMTNGKMIIMVLNVKNKPSPKAKPPVIESAKKTIIYIPYNISTTKIRKDRFDSDTIYIKETREMHIRRMDSIRGKRRFEDF